MYNEMESMEITTDVCISDVLTIHTRNSVYEFFVIDPVRAYGLVIGGAVGNRAKPGFVCDPTRLEPGLKARLLIETAKGLRHITTSTIKAVKHLRSE